MKLALWEFAYRVWNSIANLFRRGRLADELKIEMENHLHFQNEQNKRMGMPAAKARKEASLNFGNPNVIEEDVHDAWGTRVIMDLIRNFRFGLRLSIRYMSSSIMAVVMLGFGIGIAILGYTSATVMLGVMTELGVTFKQEQVLLGWDKGNNRSERINRIDFQVFREEADSIRELIGTQTMTAWFHVPGKRIERNTYQGAQSTENLFNIADFPVPQLGRFFSVNNEDSRISREVVISDVIWDDFFSRDEAAIGSVIMVNDQEYVIVGVMPARASFSNRHQFWLPADWRKFSNGNRADAPSFETVIGLLKPGISIEQARTELNTIAARLAKDFPETNEDRERVRITTAWDAIEAASIGFILLFVISVFAMLLSCTNVFNIIITRTASRSHELAVRSCLGAKRSHVIWQVIIDGLVLAGFGAIIGICFAGTALYFIPDYLRSFPELAQLPDIGLEPSVIWASMGGAIFSGVFATLIPAWRASKIDAFAVLKDDSKSSSSIFIGWLSKAIVISQIAFTSVVLFLALIFLVVIPNQWERSIELPYDMGTVLTAKLSTSASQQFKDRKPETLEAFYTNLNRNLLEVPGVRATAFASGKNGFKGKLVNINIDGLESELAFTVDLNIVTPNLLEVYGVEPLSGRMISAFDTRNSAMVCVVDRRFVELHCQGGEPIGMRIKVSFGKRSSEWVTIVGVVPILRLPLPLETVYGGILLSYLQAPNWSPLILLSIDNADSLNYHQAVQLAVDDLAPGAKIVDGVYTVKERIDFAYIALKGALTAGGIIGGSIFAMALVSLYSIIEFTTSLRRKEFGIRMAVGSSPLGIVKTITKPWVITVVLGLTIGYLCLLGVLAYLFGWSQGGTMAGYANVSMQVGKVYSWVCALVCLCSSIGIGIPAWRAMRMDPMEVIREE